MVRSAFLTLLFLAVVVPTAVNAHTGKGHLVDVGIMSDRGGEYRMHRTYPRTAEENAYYYVEAIKGERYSIRITNRAERRVGVVVAVDGRNIIDGKKSELRPTERMYIIGPYETNTFDGWRTGMDRTNRFFFTEQSDSYAEKVFSDATAMGTIALAVYREKPPISVPYTGKSSPMDGASAGVAPSPSAESRGSTRALEKKSEQAGTGFGETTYSPVRIVRFEPEYGVVEKIVLKYEWRSELCRRGIISCEPKNRFWPMGPEFAPIPRDFRG